MTVAKDIRAKDSPDFHLHFHQYAKCINSMGKKLYTSPKLPRTLCISQIFLLEWIICKLGFIVLSFLLNVLIEKESII